MILKRNKLLSITSYIISIIIYLTLSLVIYGLLVKLHYYYLFVTIPMLFLFCLLTITNIIKLILTIVSMVFGRNDNDEIIEFIDDKIDGTNTLCKYTLIGIFLTLLFSIMVLDIIYCVIKEKYTFVAFSIVIWILLYYMIFRIIIKILRNEIKI